MTTVLDDAVIVEKASRPEDVFGTLTGDSDTQFRQAQRTYRRLARIVHPDVDGGSDDLFAKLEQLWRRTQQLIEIGAYGRGVILTSKSGDYLVGPLIARGDLANVYRGEDYVVKMPRAPRYNEWMKREARALRKLHTEGEERWRPYAPVLRASFKHTDADTGVQRQTNVLERLDGFYTLEQVHHAYPDGLHGRDVAWIFRRVLVALGFYHRTGLIHGAITPAHIMIHPKDHGVMVVDWCFSGAEGTPVRTRIKRWRGFYPDDEPHLTERLDIFMAARCMAYLLGDATRQWRAFLRGCQISSVPDAWRLKEEFDDCLFDMYGPRKFRVFKMPDEEEG